MKKLALLIFVLLLVPMLVCAQNETSTNESEEDGFLDALADKIAAALIRQGKEEVKSEVEEQKSGLMEKYGIEDNLALLIFIGIVSVVMFIVLKVVGGSVKWVILAILFAILAVLIKMALN